MPQRGETASTPFCKAFGAWCNTRAYSAHIPVSEHAALQLRSFAINAVIAQVHSSTGHQLYIRSTSCSSVYTAWNGRAAAKCLYDERCTG